MSISKDIFIEEILKKYLFHYTRILAQVNKEWNGFIKEFKENHSKFLDENDYFYFLVQDFIQRKDFSDLKIEFIFQDNREKIIEICSRFGLLDLIKWFEIKLIKESYPTKKFCFRQKNNSIKKKRFYMNYYYKCLDITVFHGHFQILKYLHENFGFCFQFLHVYRPKFDVRKKNICERAAFNGHLECLKYLHENGYPWDYCSTINASANGHLHCLKYLCENKCEYRSDCLCVAAKNGHLHVIKYLLKELDPPCIWGENVISLAIEYSNFECFQYLYENGCPMNYFFCLCFAKSKKDSRFLDYLVKNNL